MEALSVKGLCKEYPSFSLKDISFSVEQGTIMGFIGRNGAGKTTTLKSILNLVHPSRGEIRFFGMELEKNELEIKKQIGFVSGGVDYYVKKKIKTITGVTRRFYDDWDEQAYRRYMARFELDENKTPDQLSAGMKVKYALTLALSHRAKLLILDEPTSGLDPVSRDDLLDVFLSLQREGVSILFSTHITSDLDRCADSITYIRRGEIAASMPLERFLGQYMAAETDADAVPADISALLIGSKPAKHGYTAIVNKRDAAKLPAFVRLTPADLETAMIHLEKE